MLTTHAHKTTYIYIYIYIYSICNCNPEKMDMSNKKDTQFYKNIRPCIEKYLTKHSENGKVEFESDVDFFYGNSGFRDKFEKQSCDLLNAINKSGIFLGLLFIKYNYSLMREYKLFNAEEKEKHTHFFQLYKRGAVPWKNVGIIITASHNPADENGVKILDQKGKQLNELYETCLTEIVNAHIHFLRSNRDCSISDIIDHIIDRIANYFKKEAAIDMFDDLEYEHIRYMDDLIYYYNFHNTIKANICIGFDTRESGIFLNKVLIESLHCVNIKKCINNMCYVTTPCMHFVINYLNCLEQDERISKVLQERAGYTFHKKKEDLDYLDSFYIKEVDQIKQLYFDDVDRSFCSKDFSSYGWTALCSDNKMHTGTSAKEDINIVTCQKDLFYWINRNFDNILNSEKEEVIYVDCANGISGMKLDKFMPIFKLLKKKLCKINYSKEKTDVLNFRCGSEYVYSKRKLPEYLSLEKAIGQKCCTFDGDADRIIYFYVKGSKETVNGTHKERYVDRMDKKTCENGKEKHKEQVEEGDENVALLDGAKIICLFFQFITYMLSQINLKNNYVFDENEKIKKIDISIIQTAYVNSANIHYLQHVKNQIKKESEIFKYIDVNIKYAKTGIKHLERIARQSSIGIFFEPNGHGTIYTNIKELDDWARNLHITDNMFFSTLKKYLLCFSQTSGDAIIDFYLIELTLKFLNLTIEKWDKLYQPFPSYFVNLKCKKSDLQNFQSHPEHEQYLIRPISLQKKIEEIVEQVDSKCGRCLVRPSGTENLVRIFAEAETSQQLHQIIDQVRKIVQEYISIS